MSPAITLHHLTCPFIWIYLLLVVMFETGSAQCVPLIKQFHRVTKSFNIFNLSVTQILQVSDLVGGGEYMRA